MNQYIVTTVGSNQFNTGFINDKITIGQDIFESFNQNPKGIGLNGLDIEYIILRRYEFHLSS